MIRSGGLLYFEILNCENKIRGLEDLASKIEKEKPKVAESFTQTDSVSVHSVHVEAAVETIDVGAHTDPILMHSVEIQAFSMGTNAGIETMVVDVHSVYVEASVKALEIGIETETKWIFSNIQESIQFDLYPDLNSQKEPTEKQIAVSDQNKTTMTEKLIEKPVPDKHKETMTDEKIKKPKSQSKMSVNVGTETTMIFSEKQIKSETQPKKERIEVGSLTYNSISNNLIHKAIETEPPIPKKLTEIGISVERETPKNLMDVGIETEVEKKILFIKTSTQTENIKIPVHDISKSTDENLLTANENKSEKIIADQNKLTMIDRIDDQPKGMRIQLNYVTFEELEYELSIRRKRGIITENQLEREKLGTTCEIVFSESTSNTNHIEDEFNIQQKNKVHAEPDIPLSYISKEENEGDKNQSGKHQQMLFLDDSHLHQFPIYQQGTSINKNHFVNELHKNEFVNQIHNKTYLNSINNDIVVNKIQHNTVINQIHSDNYLNQIHQKSFVNRVSNVEFINQLQTQNHINQKNSMLMMNQVRHQNYFLNQEPLSQTINRKSHGEDTIFQSQVIKPVQLNTKRTSTIMVESTPQVQLGTNPEFIPRAIKFEKDQYFSNNVNAQFATNQTKLLYRTVRVSNMSLTPDLKPKGSYFTNGELLKSKESKKVENDNTAQIDKTDILLRTSEISNTQQLSTHNKNYIVQKHELPNSITSTLYSDPPGEYRASSSCIVPGRNSRNVFGHELHNPIVVKRQSKLQNINSSHLLYSNPLIVTGWLTNSICEETCFLLFDIFGSFDSKNTGRVILPSV